MSASRDRLNRVLAAVSFSPDSAVNPRGIHEFMTHHDDRPELTPPTLNFSTSLANMIGAL